MSDFSSEDLTHAALAKKRRDARQDRSILTVARILDAARRLLTRIPYNEVTTRRIAAEYSISVGGIYRFFPDKDAIIEDIAGRHLSEMRWAVDHDIVRPLRRLRRREEPDLAAAVARLFEAYVVQLERRPDFRAIAFGQDARGADNRRWAGRGLTKLLVEFMKLGEYIDLDPELVRRAKVAGKAGERLIAYAYEQPTDAQREAVLVEAKKMLALYLYPKQ